MKTCRIFLSLLFFTSLVLFLTFVEGSFIASAKTLFLDDFEDGKIDKAFKFTGQDPKWVEKGGALSQTKKSVGDVCHAIIVDREYPTSHHHPSQVESGRMGIRRIREKRYFGSS